MRTRTFRLLAATAIACATCALTASAATARTLYVGNQTPGSISAFSFSSSGQLTAVPGSPFATTQQPRGLFSSIDGQRLYAGHRDVNLISQYAVGAAGALSSLSADVAYSPTASGAGAISPDGRFTYISSLFNNGGFQRFAIAESGVLTPGSTGAVLGNSNGVAITPDGRFLYVCSSTQGLFMFSRAADGATTALSGSPLQNNSCSGGLAVTPDGRFLVTASSNPGVRTYTINADGSVTNIDDGGITGPTANAIELSPDGRTAYVMNAGSAMVGGNIAQFSIASDGTVEPQGTPVTVSAPNVYANGLAISPDGRFLVVGIGSATSNVRVYSTAGGALTEVQGSPFSSGANMGGGSPTQEIAFQTNNGPSLSKLAVAGKDRKRTFTASGGADPDGAVAEYRWDFGDGKSATSSTPKISHTYSKSGNYDATVTAVDDEGCGATNVYDGRKYLCNSSGSASASVAVDARPPSFSRLKLAKRSVPRGGKIKLSFKLSEAATVKVLFQTKSGKKYRSRGTLSFKSKSGRRSKTLTLKIKRRTLAKGSYRLLVTGTDSRSNTSSAKKLALKIR